MWKAHDDKKLTQAGNGKDHSIQGNVYYANWYDRYQIKFIAQKQIKPLGHNVIGFLNKLQKNSILEFEWIKIMKHNFCKIDYDLLGNYRS